MASGIVVTGATGRVGANVVRHLSHAGHDIVACMLKGDPQEAKLEGLACRREYFDILDGDACAEAIRGADAVVHAAAVMEGMADKMPPSKFFDINVKGCFNVLEGVRRSGEPARLICFSSTAAYDVLTVPRTPVREDHPLRPLSLYGMNKILIEDQVRQYGFQHDVPFTIIRPNYVVAGPEILDIFRCGLVLAMLKTHASETKCQLYCADDPEGWRQAVPALEADKRALCVPRCPGGRSWRWHMTDVRDVVSLVEVCLADDNAVGRTFNIAARDACEWDVVVPYVAQRTGRPVVDVEFPNLWQFSFDQSASRECLGFEPQYDHKGIVDTAVAMREGKDVGIIPGSIAPLAFE
jgi:UDP-glucose 4-epimerase